ncbi:hypothetical protein HYH02_002631 [Chlamydomonas schloesseri]|uniref:Uncharacterized protein n=1 Tax=Chlamydomonas schloesseri TaxID=2026947 RepID=A0A835WTQ7_9CHLO|nr:hypothetical protein HYH02_002631 [Chlamydomonas schloesseri]|eukprot:KAG2452385.1 hypothetical protein HYH02_002631 [Chlamydomonas schloesseri]
MARQRLATAPALALAALLVAACVKSDGTKCGNLESAPCDLSSSYCNNVGTGSSALVYILDSGINVGDTVGIQVHDGGFKDNATTICSITVPGANENTANPAPPSPLPPSPLPPSPAPPLPNIASCVAPTVCPANTLLQQVGIPNYACSTCTAAGTCLTESTNLETSPLAFTHPNAARNYLDTASCPYRRVADTQYTALVKIETSPGTIIEVPVSADAYPLVGTSPAYTSLNAYLAAATSIGDAVAVACYTTDALTTVDKYIVIQRIATATDNYACLTCKWYNTYEVRAPQPSCSCASDTAWAFPVKAVLSTISASSLSSTTEILLPAPYNDASTLADPTNPGLTRVWWAARPEANAAAWGGYIRISGPLDSAREFEFDMCAGCAQNSLGTKGYIMGKLKVKFQPTTDGKTSVMSFVEPSAGAYTTSDALQVFQSFVAPPDLNPGSFQRYTGITPVTLPFSYGTSFSVNKVTVGPVTLGRATLATVPTSNTDGVYIAVHMNVGGGFCPGSSLY